MSSSFESRRRKNGKIIAPVITHDNAAMVITMGEEEKRVGELDEWESLFTDSLPGQSGRYELEPVCVYIYIYIYIYIYARAVAVVQGWLRVMHGRNGRHTSVIGPCSVVG